MPHSDTVAVHAGEPAIDRKDAPITPDIAVGSASGYPDLKTLDAAMADGPVAAPRARHPAGKASPLGQDTRAVLSALDS